MVKIKIAEAYPDFVMFMFVMFPIMQLIVSIFFYTFPAW